VFPAFLLLILLIAATPTLLFDDGLAIHGVVALVTAMALAIVAAEIRPGEAGYTARLLRPALLLMAVPALWMLVELVPMPFTALSHPMWAGAAEALNRPIFGHISIDLGATVIGLGRYLTAEGILVVAAAVTIDRTRAEWMLRWLLCATAVSAALLIARTLFGFAGAEALAALRAASALGVVIAAASTIRSIERYETRRNNAEMTLTRFGQSLGISLLALALCWLALIIAAPAPVIFAASCGFATVGLVVMVRRFALGPLAAGALAAVAIIASIAVAAGSKSSTASGDLSLRFAAEAAPSALSMAERMMADNSIGTGVGTFKALVPIYRDISDAPAPTAPTSAAQIIVEMSRPALWSAVLLMMVAAALLLRGAMSRGRDSFYATCAAGCIITLTIEGFVDASLIETAVAILAATVFGLGLAQSVSRSSQPS
jgi:hypothetical protein